MAFVRMAGAVVALSLATAIAWAQGSKLNDAQIAHIAYTADQIDIQAAQQALEKSNNNEVRAFAQEYGPRSYGSEREGARVSEKTKCHRGRQ